MPNKRRFFAALLTALSLVSTPAFAEIDLTPYELPSEYGSSVQVISPALTLVLTDKSHGRNNENTLPTSITLYDEGKIGLQIELPDYAADGTRQLYDLFAASPTRYGLITSVPSSEGERPIRFQFLLTNGLTDGLVLNSQRGNYAFSADSICNRRNEGNAHFIDRYYWESGQISSVFVEADIIWPYTYAFSDDGCLSFIANCDDGLHFRRYSPDGSLLTDLHAPVPDVLVIPKGYFAADGSMLGQYSIGEPYSSSALLRTDETDALLWSKTLSAPQTIVTVTEAQFLSNRETVLIGTAIAKSRKLFTLFKLHVDARGNITACDIRDFTTRAAELFTAKTDTLGNLYAVTEDTQAHPIAVVPFEDLPICDDPGLVLE